MFLGLVNTELPDNSVFLPPHTQMIFLARGDLMHRGPPTLATYRLNHLFSAES